MINPNLTLKEKALAGAIFLRKHAEALADTKNPMLRISAEPRCIAADAIEQIVEENEKLRAQLVAFQKAANPAVAVDPASGPDTTACYTPFTKGDRVFLKSLPHQHGTVTDIKASTYGFLRCFVRFDSELEDNRWVSAQRLELVPDE
ncbi:hypothetical protein GXQ56_003569 [Salmonella enterica]|nr:hypothetical protein [Salmonella enterica]EEI5688624.1 hypothetical protein [Salmonella enterica]EHC7758212.1 hypothetical protein [Salmonella enterica]